MPLTENNILFYWTAPDGRPFFVFMEKQKKQPVILSGVELSPSEKRGESKARSAAGIS